MPEIAVATHKRKFHKLLDLVTSSPTTQPPHASNDTTTLSARQKLDLASERARKRQRQGVSSTSLPSLTSVTRNGSATSLPRKVPDTNTKLTASDHASDKTPPNFSPWSQETFLQRLSTFSRVSLWHPKPEAIGEVAWAKRGWRCVDVNTVGCKGGCGQRVIVKLDRSKKSKEDEQGDVDTGEADQDETDEEAAFEEALTARYQREIVEGHTESCLWRRAGCKDDIYRLPVVRPAVWQPELRKRYESLLSIGESIEKVTIKSIERGDSSQSLAKDVLSRLPSVLPTSEASEAIKTRALEIAMHGWRGSSKLNAELLNCDACFQRIGLWMYTPGYRPRTSTSQDNAEDEVPAIDLVEMHREHCPWRNVESQHATGSLAGLNACEILLRVVSMFIREQRRRTEEDRPSMPDDPADVDEETPAPTLSREEINRLDKERESKLQKLKRLFTIKRSSKLVGGKR